MNFYVMTLFPELIENVAKESILGRAVNAGLISVTAVNFRAYSKDKHRHVDDYTYGGGAGMLIKPEPVYDCYEDISQKIGHPCRVVYLTPGGRVFTEEMAEELSKEEDLILLCGHYEGIDERVIDEIVTDQISIGDYVLTGGELPALVLLDAVSRLVPGVLSAGSAETESFSDGLLEYPQYTRPEVWHDVRVPEILISGDHRKVDRWRREESLRKTLKNRPDLLRTADLTKEDKAFLKTLKESDGIIK
ncbi:MAG: tRNA (guanosine(37)-N1)-methyltransferase TrmD [Lachnospiraceae bacterium]|nr:tRNA (guanosine(37)-N1)-methyltransferase TrmD [Lachnospiraceae bacterium]